jgi:pimeloyl-ACP methyl ester carboxylesterase
MEEPEVVFLHALPLTGAMWRAQRSVISVPSHASTLYGFGPTLEDWAKGALSLTGRRRLILVGCSVGGSCALEIAALAPERIAGLMLIGTKADRRPDPAFLAEAISTIRDEGRQFAWQRYWQPLFSPETAPGIIGNAEGMMMDLSIDDLVRGVEVFHARPSRAALLPMLDCPVMVVTGEEDRAPGLRTSRAQAAAVRRGSLHVIPGCGHYVPLEQPVLLNHLLQALIAACG